MIPLLPALIFLFLSGSSVGRGPGDYAKFLDSIEAMNVRSEKVSPFHASADRLDLCFELLTLATKAEHKTPPVEPSQDAVPLPEYVAVWAEAPTLDSSRTRDGPAI